MPFGAGRCFGSSAEPHSFSGLQSLHPNALLNALVYELNAYKLARFTILRPDLAVIHADDGHVAAVFLRQAVAHPDSSPDLHACVAALCSYSSCLGSLRESIQFNHPYLVELSSALQPIAVAYLAAFLLVRKSWKFQASVGAGILIFYALLLAFVPAPGVPAGSYDRNANLSPLDRHGHSGPRAARSTGARSSAPFRPSRPRSWACCWASFL